MTDEAVLTNENTARIVGKNGKSGGKEDVELAIKVYKRRWLMMALYIFFASLVAGQWIEYSIISNIVMRYVADL